MSLPSPGAQPFTGPRPERIAERVVAALSDHVYRAARERALHDAIETVLRGKGFRVEREFRLNDRDRPDFVVDRCVAVEVKMRASGSAVLSQLARYAAHDRVRAIVVATPRLSSLTGMPDEILGVAVRPVALSGPGLARAVGLWEVEAGTDVMIRIKRIFPRVAATKRGTVTLTSTLEVARDLEWLIDRWPMTASPHDRRRLRTMAGEHRRAESAVQHVLSGGSFDVAGGPGWVSPSMPLRDYQRTARDLVWATGGVLVADELGMGKTFTSLALLEQPQARPALAVTLTGTMPRQWRRQLKTFYPDLTSVEVRTGPIHSVQRRGRTADLIVMNYAKLAKWQHHLKGVVRTVIFDEVQELRREESERYKAAATIAGAATYRVGLSGTPIYNYGGEIHNVIDVLRPGALGSRQEFAREWCHTSGMDTKTRVHDPVALRSHLISQGLLLYRTLDEAGIEVPEVIPIEQSVPSDPKVLSEIEGNAVALARLILDQSANPRQRWTAAGRFDWIMRQHTGIAKAPLVADFVDLLLQSEQRVLLLGWHHACHDIWAERLRRHNPSLYTGRETNRQKERSLADFIAGRSRVLIMSLRSGAGIDGLQDVLSTLVFGELDWSPAPHKQAIGRAKRPGQTKRVRAYFCTTDEGSDPIMLETLDVKSMQSVGLIEGRGDSAAQTVPEAMTPERYEQIRRLASRSWSGPLGD